jgi:hypothetical protein
MPAKLPIADFKTQAEWHAYLDKLKPAQLKKVSSALNKILRTEFKLDTKKPATQLLEDVKKLYSVNNSSKLLEIVKGIPADDLPQPSQNLPKPTKKQSITAKQAEKKRLEEEQLTETQTRKKAVVLEINKKRIDQLIKDRQQVIDEGKSLNMERIDADKELATIWKKYGYYNPTGETLKYGRDGADVSIPTIELRRRWEALNRIVNGAGAKIEGGLKFKYVWLSKKLGEDENEAYKDWDKLTPEPREVLKIQLKLVEDYRKEEDYRKLEKKDTGEDDLINNWSVVNPSLFDLYSYDKYKEIKPEIIESFVRSKAMVKGKPNTFAINFLARMLPKSVIDEVYNKYGLQKLLLGLTYITATILDRDHPMMFDDASLPGAKLNKEYQAFIKPMIDSKNNVGYDKIIKYLK